MPAKSMIVGHSIARRLGEVLVDPRKGEWAHADFGIAHITSVDIFGVGGRKISQFLDLDLDHVASVAPDVCALLIGCNDVDSYQDPGCRAGLVQSESIAYHIISAASMLQRRLGVRVVVICQLLPRFPRFMIFSDVTIQPWLNYNDSAIAINQILESEISTGLYPGIVFWRHEKTPTESYFPFPDSSLVRSWNYPDIHDYAKALARRRFLPDGVHLTNAGLYYLYRSLRGALISGCKLLR